MSLLRKVRFWQILRLEKISTPSRIRREGFEIFDNYEIG